MKKITICLLMIILSAPINAAIILNSDLKNLDGNIDNINWLQDGLSIVQKAFVTDNNGGDVSLFSNNDYFGVQHNIHQKGNWFFNILVSVDSTIQGLTLNDLSFFAYAINGQGREQQFQRDLDFTFEILFGSSSIFSQTNVIFDGDNQDTPFVASRSTTFDLNGISLVGGEDYIFRVSASGVGSGNNAALSDITLTGDKEIKNVTAPGILSLLVAGMALLLPTRRKKW